MCVPVDLAYILCHEPDTIEHGTLVQHVCANVADVEVFKSSWASFEFYRVWE